MKKNFKQIRRSSVLNSSVSTYGKRQMRFIQNDFNWLDVQDVSNKKGLFSESDDSNVIKSTPEKKRRLPKKEKKIKLSTRTATLKKSAAKTLFRKSRKVKELKGSDKENISVEKQFLSAKVVVSRSDALTSKPTGITAKKYKAIDFTATSPCCVDLSRDIIPHDLFQRLSNLEGKQCSHSAVTPAHSSATYCSKGICQKQLTGGSSAVTRDIACKGVKGKGVNSGLSGKTTPCSVRLCRDEVTSFIPQSLDKCHNEASDLVLKVTDESSFIDDIDKSVPQQWPLLNKSKAKYVNNRRRRKNISFKITDGLTTFSFIDDNHQDLNDSIWAFQNSVIRGDNEFIYSRNAFQNSFDINFSAPYDRCVIQSTPMVTHKPLAKLAESRISALNFCEDICYVNYTPSIVETPKKEFQKHSELKNGHFVSNTSPAVGRLKEPVSPEAKSRERALTNRDKVLLECSQNKPRSFKSLRYNNAVISKLGEGLYGEVYRCFSSAQLHVAVKVIPVEGDIIINGEKQKKFSEVLPEMVNSSELSRLSCGDFNRTDAFINLFGVHCTIGSYPPYFLRAWDDYRNQRSTENERPDSFPNTQLYIVFEFTDGGVDMEHFQFKTAAQALSVLQQTVAGLAIAEEVYQFEHRDLHWGNILIEANKTAHIDFTLRGERKEIASHGVTARIIDFTLSRMTKGGLCLYQDLAADPEIFQGDDNVDYQFEIYRMMRREVEDDWSQYRPKTNVFWIDYLLRKFINNVKYKNKRSKVHKDIMKRLKLLEKSILEYSSCTQVLERSGLFGR